MATEYDDGDAITTNSQGTLILGTTAMPGSAVAARFSTSGHAGVVLYDSSGNELISRATAADDMANPTTGQVLAHMMGYDGTNWDRARFIATGINTEANSLPVTLAADQPSIEVEGDAISGAPAAGNPVLTGGQYDATARTVDTGDVTTTALTINGHTIVAGQVAENGAVLGNPVLTGGRYDSTARALAAGDVGAVALDESGRLAAQDPMLNISRGLFSNMSVVNKFGRATAITTTNDWEIWDGNAAYVFPATALMTSMSQTVDQAAMQGQTIELQGLDASWDPVTQTKALDGADTTTVITLDTPMIRCFRMKVLADVVSDSPIRCHNAGETQDYAIISIGNNQTLMAVYTIPNGFTGYMTNYYCTANPGGGAPTKFNVKLWASDRDNTYAKQLKHIQGVSADSDAYGRMQHFFKPYYKFTQKTDVYLTGLPTGASVDTSGGFDIILVAD